MNPKKLFIDTNDYYKLAHIGWGDEGVQFHGYIEGYKTGADALIEKAITSNNISILETLVYPALFLYRHFLELQLKRIIFLNSEKTHDQKKGIIKNVGHNLKKSWTEVKTSINDFFDEGDNSIAEIEELILEFHQFDEASLNFRYPIRKDNLQIAFNISERFDLMVVKDQMDKIEEFFLGVNDVLLANQEAAAEDMRGFFD